MRKILLFLIVISIAIVSCNNEQEVKEVSNYDSFF